MGKGFPVQQMVLGKLASHMQKAETGPLPDTLHKINSRWIKDLNIRPGTIKNPRRKSRQNHPGHRSRQGLHGKTPKARATKAKIAKWDLIKLQSFCTAKETIFRVNQQPIEWEKLFCSLPT